MRLLKFTPVALAILFFSCGKDDTTTPVKQTYLPSTITLSSGTSTVQKDSFVYNDANLPVKVFLSAGNKEYNFGYNANGALLNLLSISPQGTVNVRDTVVYKNGTAFLYDLDGDGSYTDSLQIKLDDNKDVTLYGSKDTIVDEFKNKHVSYVELTYANGNPRQQTNMNVNFYANDSQPYVSSATTTFAYDDKPNGLQALFRSNPVMYLVLNESLPLFSTGKNNLTSTVVQDSGSSDTYNFTNSYDPVSGYLSSQTVTENNDQATITYTYIKAR